MTAVAEDTAKEKAEAIKARNAEMEAREKKLNESRTGKGTRVFLGMTRGRGPQEIQYENWDDSQPDTLPTTLNELADIHKSRKQEGDTAEKELVRRWILGDNEVLYSEASDPVNAFVEASWPDEYQKQFKLVVKNYAAALKLSIEDAANLIKPQFVAGLSK